MFPELKGSGMTKSFFRKEALQAATRVEDVQRTMRVSSGATRLTAAALATALAGAVTWSAFIDVPIHVEGNGVLVRGGGTLVTPVAASAAGYIAQIPVRPGQTVAPGDVLARLVLPEREAEVAKNTRMLKDLKRSAEHKARLREADARAETASFDRQTRALETRIAALSGKYDWLQKRLADLQKLQADGVVSKDAVSTARIAAGAAGDDLAAAQAERVALDMRREEAASARKRAALQDQLEIERVAADLAAARAILTAGSVIKADAGGVVTAINTRPGALVAPGAPVFEIMTGDAAATGRLEALAFVPLQAGKRLAADDRALVTPADLPVDRHDRLIARVAEVSDVPVSTDSLRTALGDDTLVEKVTASGPVFEVRLTFEPAGDDGAGYAWTTTRSPHIALTPGTPFEARVTVERRPLLALAVPAFKRFLHLPEDDWTGRRE